MSRHSSPAGRRAHPGPVPGRAAARPAPSSGPRHAAPAVRNGLGGAAATGTALAVLVPALGALPAAPDDPTLSVAAAGVVAPTLASASIDVPVRGPEAPAPVLVASLAPVRTSDADLPPAADAAGLIKSVGLVEEARAAEEARLAREARAQCDADLDGLGRVRPGVRDAARFLSCLYDEPTLIGVADRARVSDHPRGLAVDLMVRGEKGDRIAECALANQDELGVAYVIWEQRVNYGDGWERMDDRGSDTANHVDHVHVSFVDGGGSGDPTAERCG